ncbi:MAG: hypothetical protein AAF998_08250 [Bacteroidota bacterium]
MKPIFFFLLLCLVPVLVPAQTRIVRHVTFAEGQSEPDLTSRQAVQAMSRYQSSRYEVAVEIDGSIGSPLAGERYAAVRKLVRNSVPHALVKERYTLSVDDSRTGSIQVSYSVVLPDVSPVKLIPEFVLQNKADSALVAAAPPAQEFQIDAEQDAELLLNSGSRIYIPRGTFIVKKEDAQIDVKVREFKSPGELIAGNLPTMAGEEVLTTAGSMFFSATVDGAPVAMQPDNQARVFHAQEKPRQKVLVGSPFYLYVGVRDRRGNLDWISPEGESYLQNLSADQSLSLLDSPQFRDIFGGGETNLAPKYAVSDGSPRPQRVRFKAPKYEGAKIPRARFRRGYVTSLRIGFGNVDRPIVIPEPITVSVEVQPVVDFRAFLLSGQRRSLLRGKFVGDIVEFSRVDQGREVIIALFKVVDGQAYTSIQRLRASRKRIQNVKWKKVSALGLAQTLQRLTW